MPTKPVFTDIDVLRCFLKVDGVSRANLVNELGLGEGTVRSILDILKSKGLINSTRQGHDMTDKGKSLLENIDIEIKNISSDRIFPKYKKTAVLVRKYNKKVKIDYKLRDIAVKAGADGAVILVFDGKLKIPEHEASNEFDELNGIFEYKNGNILIIAFADSYKKSETAGLKVAEAVNQQVFI